MATQLGTGRADPVITRACSALTGLLFVLRSSLARKSAARVVELLLERKQRQGLQLSVFAA